MIAYTVTVGLLNVRTVSKIWPHLPDELQAKLLALMRKVVVHIDESYRPQLMIMLFAAWASLPCTLDQ
jgi:hypothetical protein